MNRYLIQITRKVAADRPDEATIAADSIKVLAGDSGVTQDPTKDNFFLFEARNEANMAVQLIKIIAVMPHSDYKLNAGDGFVVIPYDSRIQDATSLRETAKAEIHFIKEGTSGIIIKDTLVEAMVWIASNLGPSDGVRIIDELPRKGNEGSRNRSKLIYSRPSLHPEEDGDSNRPFSPIKNRHGRKDKDRA